jgi:hypothetical protein
MGLFVLVKSEVNCYTGFRVSQMHKIVYDILDFTRITVTTL